MVLYGGRLFIFIFIFWEASGHSDCTTFKSQCVVFCKGGLGGGAHVNRILCTISKCVARCV